MPSSLTLTTSRENLTVAEHPAVNASPLIYLSKAGLIHLLQLIGEEIIIPKPVASEIQQRGAADVTVQAIVNTPWLKIVETPPVPEIIQSWDLGAGESSVLTWGYLHPDTEVIVDDLAARRCAQVLEISVRGTLGLVLIAKQRGEIPAARPLIEQLRQSGMYLSNSVINRALALVGE
jgi:predicted nucleic acid-binding protein